MFVPHLLSVFYQSISPTVLHASKRPHRRNLEPAELSFFSSFQPHPHLSSSVSADQSCYLCFVFKTPLSHFCCVIHSAALTPGTEAEMNLTETPSLLNSPPRSASSRTSRTPGVVPADYRTPVSQSPLQPPSAVLALQNLFTNNKDGAHC